MQNVRMIESRTKGKQKWRSRTNAECKIETEACSPGSCSRTISRRRSQGAVRAASAIGRRRQQGNPEIPVLVLRAVVATKRAAKIAEGTGSRKFSAQRSTDAGRLHRQSSGADRQQNV